MCSDSIEVGVPVGAAFALAADVTRWPLWLSCVVSAQQPDGREIQRGEEVHLCVRDGRRRWQEDFEVVRYLRNAFLWLEGSLSASRRIELRFEQRRDSTRINLAIAYPVFGGLFGKIVDAVMRKPRIGSELRNSLLHLKSVVEEIAAHRAEDSAPVMPAPAAAQDPLEVKEPLFA